jgi:hypothetical protein
LVADALAEGQKWSWGIADGDAPCPVVVSRYWLDLYNMGMARAGGLPLLTPQAAVGRRFELVLGESVVGLAATEEPVRRLELQVVGLSAQPGLLGLVLPLEVVRGLNARYAPGRQRQYVELVAQLKPGADRDSFLSAAGELGLRPSREEALGTRIKTAARLVGWSLIGLALAVFALGLATFYLLFAMIFHSRRLDLVRLRTLGLTPAQSLALALAEVAVLSGAAIVLAATANLALGHALERAAEPLLQRVATLPEGLLAFSPVWMALFAALILVASLLPALPMLRWVVRVQPGHVIRDL